MLWAARPANMERTSGAPLAEHNSAGTGSIHDNGLTINRHIK